MSISFPMRIVPYLNLLGGDSIVSAGPFPLLLGIVSSCAVSLSPSYFSGLLILLLFAAFGMLSVSEYRSFLTTVVGVVVDNFSKAVDGESSNNIGFDLF